MKPPIQKIGYRSVPQPPQFNTSVTHKTATLFQPSKSLSSTRKNPQFNTPFSSTPKTPQFNTPLRKK